MIEPVRVNSSDSGPDIFVGSGYQIERTASTRHARQVDLISKAFGFAQIAVREREPGTFVLNADGATYHGSGAYAGGVWHFALSHRKLGFDVIDLYDVPNSLSDLCSLLDPTLPVPKSGDAMRESIPPYLLQLCAAEAVGKMLRVGLDRDILAFLVNHEPHAAL